MKRLVVLLGVAAAGVAVIVGLYVAMYLTVGPRIGRYLDRRSVAGRARRWEESRNPAVEFTPRLDAPRWGPIRFSGYWLGRGRAEVLRYYEFTGGPVEASDSGLAFVLQRHTSAPGYLLRFRLDREGFVRGSDSSVALPSRTRAQL